MSRGGARPRTGAALVAVLAVLPLAGSGCGGTRVTATSEADATARLAAFRTCAWPAGPRIDCRVPRRDEPLVQWRIRTAVDARLRGLGYGLADDGAAADCLVAVDVTCRHRTTDTIGEYIAYRREGGRQGPSEAFVIGYEEAEFVVTVADAATGATVWRGAATTVAEDGFGGDLVEAAVDAILAQFPPVGRGVPLPAAR